MPSANPFHAICEKAIRDAFEQMERTMLTPWAFINAGHRLEITNCRGRTVHYEGVRFDGSPREVFWGGFFTPCLEDQITEQLLQVLKLCRDTNWYDPKPLDDAAELLRARTLAFYRRMADIDQRLMGHGLPEQVPARSVDEEVAKMNEYTDSHLEGLRLVLTHERPSWLRRNQAWFVPLAAGVLASIPGFIALFSEF